MDILCIYYPEWHVYPEGEAIFGKGRTEWDYVDSAVPRFPGHEQPLRLLAGHPDDSNPADVAGEIDLAADAGIDVFVYDWYWADGHPIAHEALERGFLRAPNRGRMKFALMWANHHRSDVFRTAPGTCTDHLWWTLRYDREEFLDAIDYCIAHYFAAPDYYRQEGRIFFSIYSASVLVDGLGGPEATRKVFAEAQTRMARAGLPLHLSAMVRDPKTAARMADAGFDSTSAYNVTPYDFDDTRIREETGEMRQLFSHEEFADLHATFNAKIAAGSPVPFIPVVSRGWDPSPRCRLDEPFPWKKLQYPYLGIIRDLSPETFGRCVREALRLAASDLKRPGAILVNAWNEYTEGSYLMPDFHNGDAYLRALRQARSVGEEKRGTQR
ncbi:MAG: glycoside hydrolase family 99-like domain-containing protein [Kiritimatiellae bacterium]|nr:glycoside hydrolase family 99-like domain-containing protein [Kiritimatiellia bacterium]